MQGSVKQRRVDVNAHPNGTPMAYVKGAPMAYVQVVEIQSSVSCFSSLVSMSCAA